MEEARVSYCELTAVGYKWVLDSAPAGIRSAKPGYGRAFFISRGREVSRIQSLVLQIRRDTFLGFWRQVCALLVAPFIYFKSPRSVLVCVAHPCILQKCDVLNPKQIQVSKRGPSLLRLRSGQGRSE